MGHSDALIEHRFLPCSYSSGKRSAKVGVFARLVKLRSRNTVRSKRGMASLLIRGWNFAGRLPFISHARHFDRCAALAKIAPMTLCCLKALSSAAHFALEDFGWNSPVSRRHHFRLGAVLTRAITSVLAETQPTSVEAGIVECLPFPH